MRVGGVKVNNHKYKEATTSPQENKEMQKNKFNQMMGRK